MPIDRSRLTSSPLFNHFWTGSHPGLSHQGLDEVSRAGADELERYAREHDVNGNVSPPGQQIIEPAERETMAAILEDSFYGSLFELDARPVIVSKFGIDNGTLHLPVVAARPTAAGAIKLPERVSKFSPETLAETDIGQLAEGFAREYNLRKTYFEDPLLDAAEKGARVFGLFRDYARALWSRGQQDQTQQVGNGLLERYWELPYAAEVGGKDFNGVGFSAAQGLVLNFDPFEFKHAFPDATNNGTYTYLAMNGGMAPAMKYVDEYWKAKGVANTQAEALEKKSVLGYLLNQQVGHTKPGSLAERTPFATSGLNWGTVLFPGDGEVAALPPKPGFEFPLDVVDAYRNPIQVGNGSRIQMQDKDGNALTVEKEIQKNADGQAISWSAKFKTAAGVEVPSDEAFGRIVDPLGDAKGDGKFDGFADMGWWGYCDRNTAQQVYKARFKIPNLDREVIKVKAGSETISIPLAEAQMLVDVDVPDLAGDTSVGYRFDAEPQTVHLRNGPPLVGRIAEDVMRYGPGTRRIQGDIAWIASTQEQPIVGSLRLLDDPFDAPIDVRNIETITDLGDGTVDIKLKQYDLFGRYNVKGRLTEPLSFDNAPVVNGKRVLTQDPALSIRGALTLISEDGRKQRVAASEVKSIQSEMKTEMRFSEYLAYVSRNNGVYATDASPEPLVSNGMRWVNKIELDEKTDGSRPEWVGDRVLSGLAGALKREPGDKVVFGRAFYRYEYADVMAVNFSGWYQVRNGRIVNEGFIYGEPDFAWGPDDKLDWLAPSTFNPYLDPELRVALMVNGIKGMNDELATRLNLPSNWKSYQVPQ